MNMVMLTPTLDEAARLLSLNFIDLLQIMDVGEPVTVGANVTRSLTAVGDPVAGLVQSVSLENAVDGRVSQTYAIKVHRATALRIGQAIKVLVCRQEPDLVGQVLLVDIMSRNGLALVRKGYGSITKVVNQEGKEALA